MLSDLFSELHLILPNTLNYSNLLWYNAGEIHIKNMTKTRQECVYILYIHIIHIDMYYTPMNYTQIIKCKRNEMFYKIKYIYGGN